MKQVILYKPDFGGNRWRCCVLPKSKYNKVCIEICLHINVWLKKTVTIHNTLSLLWVVTVFLNQTLHIMVGHYFRKFCTIFLDLATFTILLKQTMVHSGFRRFGNLSFINHFSKKWDRLASTASDRKGAKIQHDISWFKQKLFSFQNIKIKLNARTWMTL